MTYFFCESISSGATRSLKHYSLALLESRKNPETANIYFTLSMQDKCFQIPSGHQSCSYDIIWLRYSGQKPENSIKKLTCNFFEKLTFSCGLNTENNITFFVIHLCVKLKKPLRLLLQITIDQKHPLSLSVGKPCHHRFVMAKVAR